MFAPGVAYSSLYNFSFLETFIYTSISGVISVFIFAYLSNSILNFLGHLKKAMPFLKPKKKRLVFTRRNRLIVKIKYKYGFWGLIIISPAFPSIPIGTFITIKIYRSLHKTLFFMSVSAIVWALINSIIYYYLYSIL